MYHGTSVLFRPNLLLSAVYLWRRSCMWCQSCLHLFVARYTGWSGLSGHGGNRQPFHRGAPLGLDGDAQDGWDGFRWMG